MVFLYQCGLILERLLPYQTNDYKFHQKWLYSIVLLVWRHISLLLSTFLSYSSHRNKGNFIDCVKNFQIKLLFGKTCLTFKFILQLSKYSSKDFHWRSSKRLSFHGFLSDLKIKGTAWYANRDSLAITRISPLSNSIASGISSFVTPPAKNTADCPKLKSI